MACGAHRYEYPKRVLQHKCGPQFPDSGLRWSPTLKKEQVLSAGTRKHFNGPFKAQVALEAIRAVKTVNERLPRSMGSIRPDGAVEEGTA